MERVRRLATAGVTVTLALGAGHYMEASAQRARDDLRPTHVIPVSAEIPAAGTAQTAESPAPKLPQGSPTAGSDTEAACLTGLTLAAEPAAMLALTITAPCRADERVVLRHGGLAVTGRLSSAGHLSTHLPALDTQGRVAVLFADGSQAEAAQPIPEAAAVHRFGVQWLGAHGIEVHAFNGPVQHGGPGHVSAVDPGRTSGRGGFLSLLGEAEVPLPMLAEIYTFPIADPRATVQLEAEVRASTCGRALLAEVVESVGGRTSVTELTLDMPACDGVGGHIVLKNLPRDLNMAASR
ncbi:hypothetical protein ORIO_14395 [Cereibacter azotoformans]|uniref:Translocase n=1 Tax=Cereibacter sphaeroides (strain ATCC 17025 / ATH 2.4.3) TaxID=349102 RepID=A4WW85_CERS5|nr:hypothetical protein [Cereibacter azotoformans]ULB11086.1 hypothetical protein ORIO_14395 [Cereibacter azotoformans]